MWVTQKTQKLYLLRSILTIIARFDDFPVHDLPEGGEMGGAAVLVVEVVGVFPHVESQQWFQTPGDGVAGVGFLRDDQGAIFLRGEPYPATAEEGDTFSLELSLESVEGAPLLFDLGRQRRLRDRTG